MPVRTVIKKRKLNQCLALNQKLVFTFKMWQIKLLILICIKSQTLIKRCILNLQTRLVKYFILGSALNNTKSNTADIPDIFKMAFSRDKVKKCSFELK